jgi:hypothetical protein
MRGPTAVRDLLVETVPPMRTRDKLCATNRARGRDVAGDAASMPVRLPMLRPTAIRRLIV